MRNPPPNPEAATLPLVLYRANVTRWATDSAGKLLLPDTTVFFEAPRSRHTTELEALLHHAWQVDVSTLVITCASEHELLTAIAMGPPSDGDVRLFEDGYDTQHVFYLDPALTQFFVRPEVQARLHEAQKVAMFRRAELHARHTFDVARRAGLSGWIRGEAARVELAAQDVGFVASHADLLRIEAELDAEARA